MAIEQVFAKQFQREVYEAYQRHGSKLRSTVRTKNGVKGGSTVFQTVGKDTVSSVEAQMADYSAGEWVDQLDELKTNIEERQVLANAGAFALGRKTDELIIEGLADTNQAAGSSSDGLTKEKVLEAFEMLGRDDVPDDGQRYAVIGWRQWSDLLNLQEFANAEFVTRNEPKWRSAQGKYWLGTLWIPHSGLPKSGSVRDCFWYHKSAVGHAIGQEVRTDITWHDERAAHFVSNSMPQGSALIDERGVIKLQCLES